MCSLKGNMREIVVEIEQVRRIRKRVASQIRYCFECRRHTDFLALGKVSQLFERDTDELVRFIRANGCHSQGHDTDLQICVTALLQAIENTSRLSKMKLIGEMKK